MAGLVVAPGGGKTFDWHGARVVIKAYDIVSTVVGVARSMLRG